MDDQNDFIIYRDKKLLNWAATLMRAIIVPLSTQPLILQALPCYPLSTVHRQQCLVTN
jgi:hypothetical protein